MTRCPVSRGCSVLVSLRCHSLSSALEGADYQVGFDVPHVTNDMILRFMDVDFSLLPGQAASSKSRIGGDERVYVGVGAGDAAGVPLLKGGKTNVDGESSLPLRFAGWTGRGPSCDLRTRHIWRNCIG
jgi:hypothetical protein